jgi:hypothetical protein
MIGCQILRSKVSPCTSTTGLPLPREMATPRQFPTRMHIGKIASLDPRTTSGG